MLNNNLSSNAKKTCSKPHTIKYNNQRLLLSLFLHSEQLSVSDISKKVNLSKTTITKVVNDFAKKTLIYSVGKGESTDEGGKRPELFVFNAKYKEAIVVTFNTNSASVTLMDLKSQKIASIYWEDKESITDYESCIKKTAKNIVQLLDETETHFSSICGIIICCEGIIDAAAGSIVRPVHSEWPENVSVCDDLCKNLPFTPKIYVGNGSTLMGYAHMLNSQNTKYSCLSCIYAEHHAGGCCVKNHELMTGNHGFVGNFGHIIVNPYYPIRCECGARGCFEMMVTPKTIFQNARDRASQFPESPVARAARQNTLSMELVFRSANSNDALACMLIDEVVRWFSIVIRAMLIFYDPEKIIIQGVYQQAGEYFIHNLRESVNRNPILKSTPSTQICYSTISSQEAVLVGASYFICKQYLDGHKLYE